MESPSLFYPKLVNKMMHFIFTTMFILPTVLAGKARPMTGQKKIAALFKPKVETILAPRPPTACSYISAPAPAAAPDLGIIRDLNVAAKPAVPLLLPQNEVSQQQLRQRQPQSKIHSFFTSEARGEKTLGTPRVLRDLNPQAAQSAQAQQPQPQNSAPQQQLLRPQPQVFSEDLIASGL